MFVAINCDTPLSSEMRIYPTKEEALQTMDLYLPVEIELRTIQRLIQDMFPQQSYGPVRTREEILQDGYFFNPFGTILANEGYNGYYSLYMVTPVYDSMETRMRYETAEA